MVKSEELAPVLSVMQEGLGLGSVKAKDVFVTVVPFAHGYASNTANNALEYDETHIAKHFERVWSDTVLATGREDVS